MATTLDRKFLVDVTLDLTLAGSWVRVNGVSAFAPLNSPNVVDTTASDTSGYSTSEITLYDTTATMTFFRRQSAGVYDPGQELIRGVTKGKFGTAARIGVRWYDAAAGPETGMMVAIASWKRSNTGVKNAEMADITFTNTDSVPTFDFANPFAATAAPVITGASPAAASVGTVLSIVGVGFTGTTGATHVTIGGSNATNYIVQNDNLITAVVPAGSAGSAALIVTNAVGASPSFAYTRGA